jgi:hypothetical protein
MHFFEDLQFKFEYSQKFKKNENTWNIVKICEKNTKNGNQALTNIPLAKKKLNPKIKKITSLPRA